MNSTPADVPTGSGIESVSLEILETLSTRFPVCMSSDEFHFFPQALAAHPDWTRWDRLGSDDIEETTADIRRWADTLRRTVRTPAATPAERIEVAMLLQVLTTVDQQFTEVGVQKKQPTFYLTIASIGLAEALVAGPEAFHMRAAALPGFLTQAVDNLERVPTLFRNLGLEMIVTMRDWLAGLNEMDPGIAPAIESLRRLEDHLKTVRACEGFLPAPELYAHIARYHLDCRMPLEEIRDELRREIEETETVLKQEAAGIEPGSTWQEVLARLPSPALLRGAHRELYQEQIAALGRHCLELGIVSEQLLQSCPVKVEPIPSSLHPVRSVAAYSMPPGHPPAGGTFYIAEREETSPPPADYRLLTAHETYPGHHLLDASRWNNRRRVRRHIEFPIFYEGWASFSEELLFDSGFFSGAIDRFLMAKRRYWRAVRGMVDLELNSGRRTLEEAVEFLAAKGLNRRQAEAMVRRYALKPGYQLSYTIGRRKFRHLYSEFIGCGKHPADFARRVLAEGEIGLDRLGQMLLSTSSGSGGQQ